MRYIYYKDPGNYEGKPRIWVWDTIHSQGYWIYGQNGKFSSDPKTWLVSEFTPSFFEGYALQIQDPFMDEDLKVDEGL